MSRPVVWWQIDAVDLERLERFYGELFQWQVIPGSPAGYRVVTAAERGIAGDIAAAEHSGVTFYVEVNDLQAALDQAGRLGGRMLMPPTVIPGATVIAMFADPEGNRVGLMLERPRTAARDASERRRVDVEIKQLRPELVDDFLHFFDRDAFADNPGWASCYCRVYYFAGNAEEWSACTAAENRAAMSEQIRQGSVQGLLAYADGKVAGWCNVAPRPSLLGLRRRDEIEIPDAEQVGAIVCFVIAPAYRRLGIARRLLEAACDGLRQRGLRYAEAYPSLNPRSDAEAYHGPPAMYLAAGFSLYHELPRYLIVRKALS